MHQSPSRSVLILGARGRFGLCAARAFAAAGWDVIGQLRPGAAAPDCAGVRWLPVAVDDTAAIVEGARGACVVVHALSPVYTQWERDALPLLDAGILISHALDALMVLPGNVYNFGADTPPVLHEQTAQRAHTRKGLIRVEMEHRMQQASTERGMRSVVIRAGDFFGSGKGSWFDLALVKEISDGRMTYPGALDVPTSWAYLPDLASTFVRVASRLLAMPERFQPFEVFHFAGHTLTGHDWAEQLADVARDNGWLPPDGSLVRKSMPWALMRAGAWVVPMWRELLAMRYLWQTPLALDGSKLAALIGPEPHTELPVALRQALQDLGKTRRVPCASPM